LRRSPALRRIGATRGTARDHSDGSKDIVTIANGAAAAGCAQTIP
jgi:hypothetical protein